MYTYTDEIIGKAIIAADGAMGKISDLYFEDRHWKVRYLRIDLSNWFFNHSLLVPPSVLFLELNANGDFETPLTKAAIKEMADEDTLMPITRPNTSLLYNYRAWPSFGRAGNGYPTLGMLKAGAGLVNNAEFALKDGLHILSFTDVVGYELRNMRERLGLIKGLAIDLKNWSIPFVMFDDVASSDCERVLVAISQLKSFDVHDSTLNTNLSKVQFDFNNRINPEVFLRESKG